MDEPDDWRRRVDAARERVLRAFMAGDIDAWAKAAADLRALLEERRKGKEP